MEEQRKTSGQESLCGSQSLEQVEGVYNYQGDEVMEQLLSAAGYEPSQDEYLDTVEWDIRETQSADAVEPCTSNVPFPGVATIQPSLLEPTKGKVWDRSESKERRNVAATEWNLFSEQDSDSTYKIAECCTNDVNLSTRSSPRDLRSSLILINGDGEKLHIIQSDIVIQDIENSIGEAETVSAQTDDADTFNINDLPQELLQNILKYVTQFDLCKSVAPVCRLWKDLAYDPIHWQKLQFHDRLVPPGTLINCLRRATRLKNLHYHNDLTLDEVLHISNHCSFLRELDLGFCQNLNAMIMGHIVDGCPILEVLNLEGCEDIDHNCIQLICGLVKLCDLNLSHCTRIRDESVTMIAEELTVLKKLDIDGIAYITDRAVTKLVEHQGVHMEILKVDGAELTDDSIEQISTCPNLKRFEISFAELLTGKSLRFLRSMTSLRSLRLKKGADLCGGALHHMFEVGKLNKLTDLNLSECTNVDDSVINALVRCCGGNLRTLCLCWCWNITDEGLTDIVLGCKQMQFLDLLGLDKLHGDVLREVPEKMPDLIYLNLQQCNRIQDSIIEGMVREKRDLIAVNYYGEEFSVLYGNI